MDSQEMETRNPMFAAPAGFQGGQQGTMVLADRIIMVPDTQAVLWGAAEPAFCLDFPKLTKETVG